MDVKVLQVTEEAVNTCTLHYLERPNEAIRLPNRLIFEIPKSSGNQLQAVKQCFELLALLVNRLLIEDDDDLPHRTSVESGKPQECTGELHIGSYVGESPRSHVPADDSARQDPQVVVSKESESYSSKNNPTPKINSYSGCEPVRTSNSSKTPPVEELPPSQITKTTFAHPLKLSDVDHTEPKINCLQATLEPAMSCLVEKNSMLIHAMHKVLHYEDRTLYSKELNVTEIHEASYYKDSSIEIKQYLDTLKRCRCTIENFVLCKDCKKYWDYVEHHLEDGKCPNNYCPLWTICLNKRQFSLYKLAPPGMVLFSRKEERIGTITKDYHNYNAASEIGYGGFARVYGHTVQKSGKKVVVKEEQRRVSKQSLVINPERFMKIQNLIHPNVLLLKEYVVAQDDTKQHLQLPLLFVTKHYDHRGLNEPFAKGKPKCLLDYMSASNDQSSYIFRNLLVISLHTFRALEYFASKHLVHRDVKRSNILLKLDCDCCSGIECTCPGMGGVTAILSDFDLVEKATVDGKWAKLSDSEPSGTRGMKAPELFFVDEKGKDTFTEKADIWSAFLTIMHVLLGRNENDMALDKVTKFFDDINSGIHKSSGQLQCSIKALKEYSQHKDGALGQIIIELESVDSSIEQLRKFQGGRQLAEPSTKPHRSRDNYCPKAELLTAVHGVTVMPQVCIKKAQHVFQSQNALQDAMKETWDIIQSGMCFRPESRPCAVEVAEKFSNCLHEFLKSSAFD